MSASTLRRLALVTAGVVLLGACTLQTATAPTGDVTLFASFDDTQDLTAGHTVQVSDVVVGSVRGIELIDGDDGSSGCRPAPGEPCRGRVRMSIINGQNIPVGTNAQVRRVSLLGEHFVNLTFPDDFDSENGPFYEDGDEITQTSAQLDFDALAGQAAEVLGAITADDLSSTVNALAEGVGGRGGTLNRLIAEVSTLTSILADQSGPINTAIDGLAQLGATLAPATGQVGTLLDDLNAALDALNENNDRFFATLEQVVRLATVTNETVLVPHADDLRRLLEQLDPIVDDLATNLPSLERLLGNLLRFSEVIDDAIVDGKINMFVWVLLSSLLPGGGGSSMSATASSDAVLTALVDQVETP